MSYADWSKDVDGGYAERERAGDYGPQEEEEAMTDHPAFIRAAALSEPLRTHFPKSAAEAKAWQPLTMYRALASRVLVVATTRIECAWSAYVDAVEGYSHRHEQAEVLAHGAKLDEDVARVLFPVFAEVRYAERYAD